LGLSHERQEQLFQAGAVRRPQLHDWYASGESDLPDLLGVGVGEQSVLAKA